MERRHLLRAAGGVLLLKPETVFGYQANSTVEVGLVGCGGRGNWLAPFFPEHTGARMVAVADVMRDRLESTRTKLKVDAGRAYYGPDAYHELAHSKLDAVVIETPPYFHPLHAAAAVDAGQHVYLRQAGRGGRARHQRISWPRGQKAQSQRPQLPGGFSKPRAAGVSGSGEPLAAAAISAGSRWRRSSTTPNRPWTDRSTPAMDAGQKRMVNWLGDRVLSRRHHRGAEHPRARHGELVSGRASGEGRRAPAGAPVGRGRRATGATPGTTSR